MFKFTVAALLAALLIGCCAADAFAADATDEWNAVCTSYGFYATTATAVTGSTTFEQAYYGPDFNANFAAIVAAVADLMATAIPPLDGDDPLIATLENWPEVD